MALKEHYRILLLSIATLLLVTAGYCLAGIDPVRLEHLGGNRIPLSWNNIYGPPEVISIVASSPDKEHGHRFITFAPGQELLFRLPPRSFIRLFDPTGELARFPFVISISDGNGLFVDLPTIKSKDQTSLFATPNRSKPGLARVMLSTRSHSPVSIALFTSTYEKIGKPLDYLTEMKLTAPEVKIRKRPLEAAHIYYLMEANRPTQVRLSGPARFELYQKMLYDGSEEQQRVEYHIDGTLNRKHFFHFDITTEPQTHEKIKVDGSYPPLSRSERSYFTIPQGEHVLTLVPTKSLYVRLLKKEPSNFLFPDLNNPLLAFDQNNSVKRLQAELFPQDDYHHFSRFNPDAIDAAARKLWVDTNRTQGGLASALAMRKLAERYPGLDEIQRYATRTTGKQTFFRDLIPQKGSVPIFQNRFTVFSPTLKSEKKEDLVLHPKTASMRGTEEKHNTLFTELKALKDAGSSSSWLQFDLPERQTASELRIRAILGNQPQSFGITIDNNPEIVCQLRPDTIRPDGEYRPTMSHASQLLVVKESDTLGQLGERSDFSEVKRAATISLPQRYPASRVIIRRIDQAPHPLYLSLQLRDSRPFELTENQYLDLIRKADSDETGFKIVDNMLKGMFQKRAIKYESQYEYEFAAFFRPLVRLIQTLVTDYTSSVYPPPEKNSSKIKLSHQTIIETQNDLKRAVAQHQWVVAVEHSSLLFQETSGITKQEAASQMIEALLQSGEEYLAELHLKGMLLHSGVKEGYLINWARQRLEQFYREKNDLGRLASLYAVSISKKLTPLTCIKLAEVLLEQGKQQLALRAVLVPREQYRKTELVLLATLDARWWKVFQRTLTKVSDPDLRRRWSGLEKLVQKDFEKARQIFTESSSTQSYLQALDQADTIRNALVSGDISSKEVAISNWEQWQQSLPGIRIWKDESDTIYQHAGGELLYSDAQDLHMQMFRSEPGQPIRIRLRGPVTISTTVRPLHPAGSTEPINGWARLQSETELDLIPISNNLPSQQWRSASGSSLTPGMSIEHQRSFGPGLHSIKLTSDAIPLLVSFKILRPIIETYGLPDLRARNGELQFTQAQAYDSLAQTDRISCLSEGCITLLPEEPNGKPLYFKSETPFSASDRRISDEPAKITPISFPMGGSKGNSDEPLTLVAQLMAQKRWPEALEQASMKTAETRAQTLALLTYLSETTPEKRLHYEVLARNLLNQFPDTKNGTTLLRRIAATSRWQQMPFVQGSAGLRLLPYQHWQPEEPSMRIRKALLKKKPNGQTVLTGTDSSILMMENHQQTNLKLTFSLAELPYLKPVTMSVACQLDDNQPELIQLSPEMPEQIMSITVPPGLHRVSIAILERYTNQYLWVHFSEEHHNTPRHNDENTIWSTQNKERAFHVVSGVEPLVATISGPAWVRVDELSDGIINSHYYHFAEAVQNLVVKADSRRPERLVRIFYRVADRSISSESLMRTITRNYQQVLPPLPQPALSDVSPRHRFLANLPPPLPQIHQSRAIALSYHRRRDLQEDSVSDGVEPFFQLDAGVKKFVEPLSSYLESSVLLRGREVGGPTVGIRGDYTWKIPELPLNFRVQAEALAQNPDASSLDFTNWESAEWSAKLRISAYQYRRINLKLTHRPMLSFFGRLLSSDDGGDYEKGALDQDIYTPYKADHKLGLQLSEYLSYRPWLDSQLNTRAILALNENLNLLEPDHLRFAIGWRQLLGSYQLSAAYQFTRFFADDDRDEIIDRNDFTVALLWDPLFNADNWLRFHFKYRFQFETGEHTGMIGLTWFLDGNRAIIHHRPEDDPFNTLRQIRSSIRNYGREKK